MHEKKLGFEYVNPYLKKNGEKMENLKQNIRKAVVADMFYPGDKEILENDIQNYISKAPQIDIKMEKLFGIISPHAGYQYSGPVAATGFKLLKQHYSKNVIIIAPSHREYLCGISIFPGIAYSTPLGDVPINHKICNIIAEESKSVFQGLAGHREEHSLEVQLPFLQTIFQEGFDLIPMIIGESSIEEIIDLAKVLKKIREKEDFILIASSDLSHYHPYKIATTKDKQFISILEKYDLEELRNGFQTRSAEACGIGPILLLMEYAKLCGNAKCKAFDYRNSGDTAGSKSQVVGYVSAGVYE